MLCVVANRRTRFACDGLLPIDVVAIGIALWQRASKRL